MSQNVDNPTFPTHIYSLKFRHRLRKPAKVTSLKVANVKGAKVKVSVKAFNKNAAGAKQYSAAVSKTLKTDKK